MFSVLVQQYAAVTSAHMSLELLLGQPLPLCKSVLVFSGFWPMLESSSSLSAGAKFNTFQSFNFDFEIAQSGW